jgi:hypothetical protein
VTVVVRRCAPVSRLLEGLHGKLNALTSRVKQGVAGVDVEATTLINVPTTFGARITFTRNTRTTVCCFELIEDLQRRRVHVPSSMGPAVIDSSYCTVLAKEALRALRSVQPAMRWANQRREEAIP